MSIWKGVLVRLLIVIVEMGGYVYFFSVSLLFDAVASGLDILFSLILLCGIRLAAAAPDDDHPFGHGRYEPLAGFQLSVLIILGGFGLALQQFATLLDLQVEKTLDPLAWLIPLGAVLLLEMSYQIMIHYAKKHDSPALKADAIHFRIDALNSLFATVALALAALMPALGAVFDHLGAFSIAALMGVVGFMAAKENFHQLMDRKPDQKYFSIVRNQALAVDGVFETEKLRIQLSGPDAHVDIDIEVDPSLNVEQAHRISQHVRARIQKAWPAVRDVVVHIEPYYPDDH